MRRGLLLAAAHCLIALSVTAKFAVDRQALPRVWVRSVPYDPVLPLRGRYLRIYIEVDSPGPVVLSVEGGRLVTHRSPKGEGLGTGMRGTRHVLAEPVAFFLPAGVLDPTVVGPGEELWVEVSVPRSGPPRPVRLGVRRNGVLTPLVLP